VWLRIDDCQDRRSGAISVAVKPLAVAAAVVSFGQTVNGIQGFKGISAVLPGHCRRDSGTITPNIHLRRAEGGKETLLLLFRIPEMKGIL
jgi:hypothetical protein